MPIVNDVTQLNPVEVFAVCEPRSAGECAQILARSELPLSIGGGHFSMGGQTASPGSLHLDLRSMNRILAFDPVARTIRVEAGVRWCDIQAFCAPHGLAPKIMQTYANFTVGGSLSVNAHGRYMGLGPVILSVREILLILPDGTQETCSPTLNSHLFHAAVGCHGAIGLIAEATLELAEDERVERSRVTLSAADYPAWFDANVRGRPGAVFHNADLYPPAYSRVSAVTWSRTDAPATCASRLQPLRKRWLLERYFMWAISETPFGKLRRERLIDPLLYLRKKVHWRNFEAGYDVAELEPPSRERSTYVLQEYFIPAERVSEFIPRLGAILRSHQVNAINVSIRHAGADPGSMLAWARGETFAFVLYHKQRVRRNARERVAVWTRELIDAAVACGGCHYLPYQTHATSEQLHAAYPRMEELFELKRSLDPGFRLRGALWDKYYRPWLEARAAAEGSAEPLAPTLPQMIGPAPVGVSSAPGAREALLGASALAAAPEGAASNLLLASPMTLPAASAPPLAADGPEALAAAIAAERAARVAAEPSLFRRVYADTREADRFHAFLSNIFRLFPPDRFHALIMESIEAGGDDEAIYRRVQAGLGAIGSPLGLFTHALPSLAKQKREMASQATALLAGAPAIEGLLEIGSKGRHARDLRRVLGLKGKAFVADALPSARLNPADIAERGSILQVGPWQPYVERAPVVSLREPVGLAACFAGLHHMEPERLAPFLASVRSCLSPKGLLVVRDHDARDAKMDDFVGLAHAVFNAGLGEPWAVNAAELRHFAPLSSWRARLLAAGFEPFGPTLLQEGDPSDNALMAFRRVD